MNQLDQKPLLLILGLNLANHENNVEIANAKMGTISGTNLFFFALVWI